MIRDFVNGEWVESSGKQTVSVVNPATGAELDRCPLGDASSVERAVQAAQTAFLEWRQTPVVDRIQYLFKLKPLLENKLDDIAQTLTRENGKTFSEAKASARRAIQMVETACGMPSLLMGENLEDIARGIDSRTIRQPMGVFAGIAPFNFPAMVPFWFWPFAVACGNTFILKPSERVPLTQQLIFDLIQKAGFPKGVMNLVNGGKDVVNGLCTHPLVKGVCFVGSTPVARHVYSTACAHGKRVQALGGAKNVMVVTPDAVMDKAVATALESMLGCAGERCLAGSILLCIGEDTYRGVRDRVVAAASDIRIGDGLDSSTQMGPVISKESKERIISLIQNGVDEGASLLLDGRKGVEKMQGFFLRPTVLGDVTPKMRVAREEIFGPVVLLARAKSLDEAIQWVNSSEFGNTTTIFTTNGASARKFCNEVAPSMVGINIGVPAPMSFFSFGGTKESFFGDIKAHGAGSVGFFTDTKIITERWLSESSVW